MDEVRGDALPPSDATELKPGQKELPVYGKSHTIYLLIHPGSQANDDLLVKKRP